jgi:hypothetical protein
MEGSIGSYVYHISGDLKHSQVLVPYLEKCVGGCSAIELVEPQRIDRFIVSHHPTNQFACSPEDSQEIKVNAFCY